MRESVKSEAAQAEARPREEVQVTRAVERYEYDAAFRCLYRSYVRRGLISPGQRPLRVTRHHLLPPTRVLIARTRRRVVGTLSLVSDAELGVPLRAVFNEEVNQLAARDPRVAEATCLAVDEAPRGGLELVHQLMGLAAQAAHRRDISRILIAVHPRHAPFYTRMAGFRQFTSVRPYPSVGGRPAVGLQLNLRKLDVEFPDVHRRYFGMTFPPISLCTASTPPHQLRWLAALWLSIHRDITDASWNAPPASDEEHVASAASEMYGAWT